MGDSSTLRREEGLSSLFMSLYTILGFFLSSVLFHLVSVSARKRLYISERGDAICQFAERFRVLSYLPFLCPFHVSR